MRGSGEKAVNGASVNMTDGHARADRRTDDGPEIDRSSLARPDASLAAPSASVRFSGARRPRASPDRLRNPAPFLIRVCPSSSISERGGRGLGLTSLARCYGAAATSRLLRQRVKCSLSRALSLFLSPSFSLPVSLPAASRFPPPPPSSSVGFFSSE